MSISLIKTLTKNLLFNGQNIYIFQKNANIVNFYNQRKDWFIIYLRLLRKNLINKFQMNHKLHFIKNIKITDMNQYFKILRKIADFFLFVYLLCSVAY